MSVQTMAARDGLDPQAEQQMIQQHHDAMAAYGLDDDLGDVEDNDATDDEDNSGDDDQPAAESVENDPLANAGISWQPCN